MNFNFIASDKFEVSDLQDINQFVENYPDFQTVTLNDESELELFLKLIGIDDYSVYHITGSEFSKYWDLSKMQLPEFDEEQFQLNLLLRQTINNAPTWVRQAAKISEN